MAKQKAFSDAKFNLSRQLNSTIKKTQGEGYKMTYQTTRAYIPSLSKVCDKAASKSGIYYCAVVLKMTFMEYYTCLNELTDEQLKAYGYSREVVQKNIEKYKLLEEATKKEDD